MGAEITGIIHRAGGEIGEGKTDTTIGACRLETGALGVVVRGIAIVMVNRVGVGRAIDHRDGVDRVTKYLGDVAGRETRGRG